jgi:hypothetical protein
VARVYCKGAHAYLGLVGDDLTAGIGRGVSEKLRDVVGEVNGVANLRKLAAIVPKCSGEVGDGVGYRQI